jgi:hypothetical protein
MGCLDEFTGDKRCKDDSGWFDCDLWVNHQQKCDNPDAWTPDGSTDIRWAELHDGKTVTEVASGPGYGGFANNWIQSLLPSSNPGSVSRSTPAPTPKPAIQTKSPDDIIKECEGLPLDTVKTKTKCGPYKDDIIKAKCEWKSGEPDDLIAFNTPTCKTYCQNIPNEGCNKLFQNFCKNINNKTTCNQFCNKDENKEACLKSIINSCSDKQITTDAFCQNTIDLVGNEMRTKYETIVDEYCNDKQVLEPAKKEEKDDFCVCYDKELIEKRFSHIKKDYIKNFLKEKTQCNPYCLSSQTSNVIPEKFLKRFPKRLKPTEIADCNVPSCPADMGEQTIGEYYFSNYIPLDKNHANCKPSGSTSSGSTSTSSSGSTTTSSTSTPASNNSFIDKIKNNYELIGLILLLVIVLSVLAYIFLSSDESKMQHPHPHPQQPYSNNRNSKNIDSSSRSSKSIDSSSRTSKDIV